MKLILLHNIFCLNSSSISFLVLSFPTDQEHCGTNLKSIHLNRSLSVDFNRFWMKLYTSFFESAETFMYLGKVSLTTHQQY